MSNAITELKTRVEESFLKIRAHQRNLNLNNIGRDAFFNISIEDSHTFMQQHSPKRGWLPYDYQVSAAKDCEAQNTYGP